MFIKLHYRRCAFSTWKADLPWLALTVLSAGLLISPPAAAEEKPRRITVATWNLEWFFDEYKGDNYSALAKKLSAPSREEWQWKRNGVAAAIAKLQPTILALQEVESRRVLYYLTKRLKDEHQLEYRIAFVEGADFYTEQDEAVLYQSGLVEFSRKEQSPTMWKNKQFYNLQKHLFCRFVWGRGDDRETLTLLNLHLRAMPKQTEIRRRQCRLAHRWVKWRLDQGENVLVLGDINTEETVAVTPKGSDVHILRGLATKSTTDNLVDLHRTLKVEDRITHLIGKQFDRVLVSDSLMNDAPDKVDLVFKSMACRKDVVVRGKQQDKDHWNIFYDIPQEERDLSDHYPLVAEFEFR